jgi:hypothetical protein
VPVGFIIIVSVGKFKIWARVSCRVQRETAPQNNGLPKKGFEPDRTDIFDEPDTVGPLCTAPRPTLMLHSPKTFLVAAQPNSGRYTDKSKTTNASDYNDDGAV